MLLELGGEALDNFHHQRGGTSSENLHARDTHSTTDSTANNAAVAYARSRWRQCVRCVQFIHDAGV